LGIKPSFYIHRKREKERERERKRGRREGKGRKKEIVWVARWCSGPDSKIWGLFLGILIGRGREKGKF
jgi:hypothetical protein